MGRTCKLNTGPRFEPSCCIDVLVITTWCHKNEQYKKKILGTFKPKGFITSSTSASIQIWSASGSTQGTAAEIHSSQWVRKNVSLYMICIDLNGRNLSRQILLFVIFHLPNIVFFFTHWEDCSPSGDSFFPFTKVTNRWLKDSAPIRHATLRIKMQ